jgi:hypothetical protein
VQLLPVQQGAPDFPHAVHTEVLEPAELVLQARSKLAQLVPLARTPLAQHGSPALPQAQRPDLQDP